MANNKPLEPRAIRPISQPLPLADKEQDFYLLAQSHSSNQLQKKITMRIAEPAQFDLFGNGSVVSSDFRLFIRGYRELINGVNQSAAMLLDSLMITATQDGLQSTLVKLPPCHTLGQQATFQ